MPQKWMKNYGRYYVIKKHDSVREIDLVVKSSSYSYRQDLGVGFLGGMANGYRYAAACVCMASHSELLNHSNFFVTATQF